jgi:flagellum-specific ATP synthase
MISPLSEAMEQVRTTDTVGVEGRVRAAAGMTIEASGLPVAVGSLCEVGIGATKRVPAEVIGLRDGATLLMPLGPAEGLATGQAIRYVTRSQKIAVTPALLGRVVDSMGRPIDGGPSICADESYPLHASPPNSAKRPRIDQILSVGVRSIDALLTVGRGQRLGIFAGTGVGKSVLLGMMARHTSADVAVIGLVGERGREVGDFIAKELGAGGLKRSVRGSRRRRSRSISGTRGPTCCC